VATATRSRGLLAALRRVSVVGMLGVVPALVVIGYFVAAVQMEYAFDFRQFFQGGVDVLDGRSPYPDPQSLSALPNDGRDLDAHEIQDVFLFPYPAIAAIAITPLAALPFGLAAGLLTLGLIASLAGGLWLLGIRDWRCHAIAFSSILVLGAITLGTLTPLLFLLLAVAWRERDRARYVAPALAVAIALKLFLLPVVVWLVATRRFKAALVTVSLTAAALVGGWAAIGWDGFRDYPRFVDALSTAVHAKSLSVTAFGVALGLSEQAAAMVATLLAGALVVAALVVARRAEGDMRSFVLALAAALALSPIGWLHYYLLLLIPLALSRPRFGPLWLVPALFWITPFQENEGDVWRFVVVLSLAAVVFVAATVRPLPFRLSDPALRSRASVAAR
jgi:hypothetical protein